MIKISPNIQKFSSWLKRLKVIMLLLVFLVIPTSVVAQEKNRMRLRIEFDINRKGKPTNLEIIESSGNKKFDKETLEAMEKMRFERSDDTRKGISADINIELDGLNSYVYPPQMVKEFIDGCSNGEEGKEFCVCMIQQAEKQYPWETFLEVSLEISEGKVSPQSKEIFQYLLSSCITKVPIEEFF
ncbi:MAG: energy transducer TonB [Okeania sp. SIO3I5]|uniref:energy transducer TonB n=1 Tax=Okeania sp. SIO3I5 TaxID=2607805 RepID=UPI0013BD392E|nr:energy transducer TonB [Okeania sp. SIO3I5]NEQ36929.1 energy transducer TonB [Okeania sp. SIO3I5]